MVIRGQIESGVVVIDGRVSLPDGTRVLVVPEAEAASSDPQTARTGSRVCLPLVPSKNPGSVPLDSARIAEILNDRVSP